MITVTFAIPQESRVFLAGRRRQMGNTPDEVRVIHTGIGLAAAATAIRTLIAEHAPLAVISSGFAGALDSRLRVGDAIVATNCSAPALVERCRARWKDDARLCFGPLTTAAHAVETPGAKAQLAHDSQACAVDMETSAIDAVCRTAGIPLLALRVISDTAEAPLPLPFEVGYDLTKQRPRPFAVGAHLALNPRAILPLARFMRHLAFARTELARRLEEILPDVRAAASEPAPH